MTLTRADIADRIVNKLNFPKCHAQAFVDDFFDLIMLSLESGEEVKLTGFGNFVVKLKNARPGRNPRTGEDVTINSRRVVKFHAGPQLRGRILEADLNHNLTNQDVPNMEIEVDIEELKNQEQIKIAMENEMAVLNDTDTPYYESYEDEKKEEPLTYKKATFSIANSTNDETPIENSLENEEKELTKEEYDSAYDKAYEGSPTHESSSQMDEQIKARLQNEEARQAHINEQDTKNQELNKLNEKSRDNRAISRAAPSREEIAGGVRAVTNALFNAQERRNKKSENAKSKKSSS